MSHRQPGEDSVGKIAQWNLARSVYYDRLPVQVPARLRVRIGQPVGYGVIGSTTDSGSVSLGSSPGTPANMIIVFLRPRRLAA
jgi:hypothetical protein